MILMLLIKNANLYSPKREGICSILVEGSRIADVIPASKNDVVDRLALQKDISVNVIDAQGALTIPGIIDRHVHLNGAGGEGGPVYRTPPLQLSSFIKAGVTSTVGMLGTDGVCRSLRELLMKARALEEEGISTWILTGNYRIPSVTFTGGVMDDLCLIDKVIGLKIALSDHRGSHPSVEELRRAISDARTGGMLAGKPGFVCIHMGSEKTAFEPLLRAIEDTDIPISQLAPTHISRSRALLEESIAFGKKGGNLDITTSPGPKPLFGLPIHETLKYLLDQHIPLPQITISSDGNGSMPRFDKNGKLEGMGIGPIDAILNTITELWDDPDLGGETVLSMGTSNVADQLALANKGRLQTGKDADILILGEDKKLKHVIAKGEPLMQEGRLLKKGTFE